MFNLRNDTDLSARELDRLNQSRREEMIDIYKRVEASHRDLPHVSTADFSSCDECEVLINQLCADAGFEDAKEESV